MPHVSEKFVASLRATSEGALATLENDVWSEIRDADAHSRAGGRIGAVRAFSLVVVIGSGLVVGSNAVMERPAATVDDFAVFSTKPPLALAAIYPQ